MLTDEPVTNWTEQKSTSNLPVRRKEDVKTSVKCFFFCPIVWLWYPWPEGEMMMVVLPPPGHSLQVGRLRLLWGRSPSCCRHSVHTVRQPTFYSPVPKKTTLISAATCLCLPPQLPRSLAPTNSLAVAKVPWQHLTNQIKEIWKSPTVLTSEVLGYRDIWAMTNVVA